MANRPHLQAIDSLVNLLTTHDLDIRLRAAQTILDNAPPQCPFCLYEPPSRADLSIHLDDCSGRKGYMQEAY